MALKSNEYNTGGVNSPKKIGPGPDAQACNVAAASATTAANNPNVNNVDPGSH
jgi:hypothetical protein